MKLYRGVCKLLFKQVDPYFKGNGEYNSFGPGTSYAIDYEVGKIYALGCQNDDVFGYILEYNATGINKFEVTPIDFLEQPDYDFDIDGCYLLSVDEQEIRSNQLSSLILKKGYNSILINESNDIPTGKQLFILNDSVGLELESILFTINYPLGVGFDQAFNQLGLKQVDANIYEVPLSKVSQLDEILFSHCF